MTQSILVDEFTVSLPLTPSKQSFTQRWRSVLKGKLGFDSLHVELESGSAYTESRRSGQSFKNIEAVRNKFF
jgi:hypothetical protein